MTGEELKAVVLKFKATLDEVMKSVLATPDSPPVLYHYTTAEGLAGLAKEWKIWATHYQHVNDKTEYIYADKLVNEVMNDLEPTATPVVRAVLDAIRAMPEGILGLSEPYIACFCEDGDLLSQWRGYGARGGGYAIGFQPRGEMRGVAGSAYHLRKVLYDRVAQKHAIEQVFAAFTAAVDAHARSEQSSEVSSPLVRLVFDEGRLTWRFNAPVLIARLSEGLIYYLSAVATVCKDSRFKEEQEWRIVHLQPRAAEIAHSGLELRTASGMLVPYIELDLLLEPVPGIRPEQTNFRLASVTHGPSLHPVLARRSLELLVARARLGYDVEFKGSDIPIKL